MPKLFGTKQKHGKAAEKKQTWKTVEYCHFCGKTVTHTCHQESGTEYHRCSNCDASATFVVR